MTENPDDQFQTMMAAALFGQMKMLMDRDVPLLKAFRLVVIENLQNVYGSEVWRELGVSKRSIERYRAEMREKLAMMPEIEDEPPAEVIEAFMRLEAARAAHRAGEHA